MIQFRPIPPADVEAIWGFVRPGLEQIIRRTGEKWSPSHIVQALHENRAALFVCDDGFVVLQRLVEDWTSEPYINVWAMWFMPGRARKKRKELVAWLDDTSTKFGCRIWKFGSPRMGWSAMEDNEMEIERVIWRRKTK